MPLRIALLEDDAEQAEVVCAWLAEAGHSVKHYSTGKAYLREVARETYDAHLIDWGLPDMTGLEALEGLKKRLKEPVPVLFVTAHDVEQDIVAALQAGANDYVVKPLRRMELVARLEAQTRRATPLRAAQDTLDLPPFAIDFSARRVSLKGEEVAMTPKDFDVAAFMFRQRGRLVSRGHIFEAVWGKADTLDTRTVDTHISRVRRKLQLTGEHGLKLVSVYQTGYRLEEQGGQPV
jgi:two-component system, OmpR family, response regulator RegX3